MAKLTHDDAVNMLDAIARANPEYLEALYQQYRRDPGSVDERWALVFREAVDEAPKSFPPFRLTPVQ